MQRMIRSRAAVKPQAGNNVQCSMGLLRFGEVYPISAPIGDRSHGCESVAQLRGQLLREQVLVDREGRVGAFGGRNDYHLHVARGVARNV